MPSASDNQTTERTAKKRLSDARPVGENNSTTDSSPNAAILPPDKLRERLIHLRGVRNSNQRRLKELDKRLTGLDSFLAISDKVTDALDVLSEQLFRDELGILEEKLTLALDEVLGQPIEFKSEVKTRAGQATISFYIDRDGNREDIQKGQGGSVQNILSVGLRFFALANLDPEQHRRFVVLDEQDCWLKPEVVPNLVKVIDAVVRELGFQIIVISHHDISLFERYADKIYRLDPVRNDDGEASVKVVEVDTRTNGEDE